MARLLLSKATLSKQRQLLHSYQRFLPSLDMKRQQLRAALKKVEQEGSALEQALEDTKALVAKQLPMLANRRVNLDGLVTVQGVAVGEVNIAGCKLPEVTFVEVNKAPLAALAYPPWVYELQERLAKSIELQARISVNNQQQALLQLATTKITQRVNLFDKVLIPQTLANIKKIQIYLGDRAREAVVTSKIAKRRHENNSVME